MIRRWFACAAIILFLPALAWAHLGSPDVFFAGDLGPYPARITVRMPNVVPGRAEIIAQVQASEPVIVSFLPVYSRTAISNAPPPDVGQPVPGETNLYVGDLWLMTSGAYSIQIKIHGAKGEGSVEIPVTSVALKQLPLSPALGATLIVLLCILVIGGLAIVVSSVRESELPPGAVPQTRERNRGILAGAITALIFAFALVGGERWWASEENDFRARLIGGAYPDMQLSVHTAGSQRILDLTIGEKDLRPDNPLSLLPDHGKLLHLFLIREDIPNAVAHVHPVRKEGKTFQVALPPLPEGRYKAYCDLTLESSSMSFTATNSIQIPALPPASTDALALQPDPDDSWAVYPEQSVPPATATNAIYIFPDGKRMTWKHAPLHVHQDAGLNFEVSDASGNPVPLEPYMGMISHAAVMRRDGSVFAHLHPSGNYSMAAQMYFMKKLAKESGAPNPGMAFMHHPAPGESPTISLPYEFPAAGDYRIWVQFKSAGEVKTAVFDASVAP